MVQPLYSAVTGNSLGKVNRLQSLTQRRGWCGLLALLMNTHTHTHTEIHTQAHTMAYAHIHRRIHTSTHTDTLSQARTH